MGAKAYRPKLIPPESDSLSPKKTDIDASMRASNTNDPIKTWFFWVAAIIGIKMVGELCGQRRTTVGWKR